MNNDSWQRWAPISGAVYAVLYVVGLILLVFEETDSDPDPEILSYYADSGNRTGDIIGFVLLALGVLALVVFAAVLRNRLESAQPRVGLLAAVTFGSGITAAGLLVGAAAAFSATAFAAELLDEFAVDPNLVRFAFASGYALLLGGVVLALGLVLATSLAILRTGILPAWVGYLGFAAAVGAVGEAFLLPVFALPAWSLIVSVMLLTRGSAEASA